MQSIILDTNIIVSALISNSIPTRILHDLVLTQKVETCLSAEILAEYIEVLNRDKFVKYPNFKTKADIVLTKIRDISTFYKTKKHLEILPDTSDNKFLELAEASAADFLITGNSLDFQIQEFEYTKIISPPDFWNLYYP